ncbi:EF-hand domain-containing protein [Caenorhabditis elegans]|uniref:EF-hand domain-containing protein n=2 Tax=Caenorhabditis elegans TaxID=6239 RepID=Q9U2A6_CAEEL|nr:EF-hand domain-containing protein [Caenorhabditis elegans]CAB54442.2 EF-hand domain-containing protein [Caenorhabditis elegans]|eukprot:NP_496961.2 EF HanD calcium binding protein [Caenorhabditis elegans]
MASPELAEKLKKRLDGTDQEPETNPHQAPPPAPVIPQKIVENPYIPSVDTSIDDLIFKALEKKEENNNNNNNNNSNSTTTTPLEIKTERNQQHEHTTIDPRSPPPKRSILELLEQERLENELQQQSAPVPKTPVMVITKGAFPRSASPRRQQFVRENEDGNELEKRLAAQRMKKYTEEMESLVQKQVDVLDQIMSSPPPPPTSPPQLPPTPPARITSVRSDESIEEEERRRKESEETASFEELEAEIMRISRSPVPPPVLSIPPPPPPNIPLPTIPQEVQSPPSPRPTSVPPPIPSPGPSEDVNMDELIESFSDSVIFNNSMSPPPPLPPLRESSLETLEVTPEDPVTESKVEASPTPLPKATESLNESSIKALEGLEVKALEAQEASDDRPSAPTPIRDSSLPPPPPPKPETPLAIRRAGPIPTPQLLEMIHQEDCSIRPSSPTSVSHGSRPQSPAVPKKPSVTVSPLGLLCDPNLSIEKPEEMKTEDTKPVETAPAPVDEAELNDALDRRNKINEGENVPLKMNKKISLYAEFSEFSRKQIQYFSGIFKKYDEDQDSYIDFNELKRMMEKLGEAQTHIALKELIKKVDEDQDGKISQREFFLIFRLAASGELSCSEVFKTLAESVDVSKEGVLGAANFFQAKIEEQTKLSRFEEEMKEEKEEKKRQEEEKRARREKFLASKSIFH